MLKDILALLGAFWNVWKDWSARSKQKAAEQTAADMRAGAEQAAGETERVVEEIAHEREALDPPPDDPVHLAAGLRARAAASRRRGAA